jgi:hypothetical protein
MMWRRRLWFSLGRNSRLRQRWNKFVTEWRKWSEA